MGMLQTEKTHVSAKGFDLRSPPTRSTSSSPPR